MVSWREWEGMGIFVDEGVLYRESVFSVNDLVNLLGKAPATIRYWLQRGWLVSPKTRQGYQIHFFDLHTFLLGYGDKLRGLPSTNINDLIPEAYQPSTLPKDRQQRLKEEKRDRWRRKRYKDYVAWARNTFEDRKKLLATLRPGVEYTKDEYVTALLGVDDFELARVSGSSLARDTYEAIQALIEKVRQVEAAIPQFIREHGSYQYKDVRYDFSMYGATPEEIKRNAISRGLWEEGSTIIYEPR